jgi:hypothetical protein
MNSAIPAELFEGRHYHRIQMDVGFNQQHSRALASTWRRLNQFEQSPGFQAHLSTIIGSTFVALRAGIQQASSAIIASSAAIAASVIGSPG